MVINYKRKPRWEYVFRKVSEAHKIKELMLEKSFLNEQDNDSRYLLIFGLFNVWIYWLFLILVETPLPKKIEGKI